MGGALLKGEERRKHEACRRCSWAHSLRSATICRDWRAVLGSGGRSPARAGREGRYIVTPVAPLPPKPLHRRRMGGIAADSFFPSFFTLREITPSSEFHVRRDTAPPLFLDYSPLIICVYMLLRSFLVIKACLARFARNALKMFGCAAVKTEFPATRTRKIRFYFLLGKILRIKAPGT
jgi:hypothetical protein